MSKNLIPEIAKMLGVELGEEFKIDINNEIYQITKNCMYIKKMNDEGQFDMWEEVPRCFIKLLAGNAKIVKLPWKPKKGACYYTFELLGDKWVVRSFWWGGFPNEYALLDKGWIYRTCEEAQAALPKVAKEMGVDYEI